MVRIKTCICINGSWFRVTWIETNYCSAFVTAQCLGDIQLHLGNIGGDCIIMVSSFIIVAVYHVAQILSRSCSSTWMVIGWNVLSEVVYADQFKAKWPGWGDEGAEVKGRYELRNLLMLYLPQKCDWISYCTRIYLLKTKFGMIIALSSLKVIISRCTQNVVFVFRPRLL